MAPMRRHVRRRLLLGRTWHRCLRHDRKALAVLTGDNPENLALDMSCEKVFAAGQRKVETRGPFAELEDEVAEGHKNFW